ncbi:transcriptional regulator [Natronolimnobius sp. AArcel1]|uniref:DUF7527 domain-containing protein n=1 Tax=Natronolimnobius sp. AArcel1 TaxID=1679093 RepID=UPI0013EA911B|nr:transcriptional regulator [Natronolimnobius sp. AArcel1]NGM69937.1 transcriptional regulator [Natronolimnobius sp. AArcel1]
MESRTQERVEQWDSRPFSGGYDGLSDLATSGFSGAVTAGRTWLFMLNGRIVGVVDGEIEAFESATGTAYQAPHPSLPLLCAMDEQGGETRAQYYTNETSLAEVDQTLQNGSFTGYIELAENVLSGDYYAVYYGGRRMAAAYIGNANRLVTGDEAFEKASDEVGIYEVIDVDISVTDVPGSEDETPVSEGTDTDASTTAADTGASSGAADDGDIGIESSDSRTVEPTPEPSVDPTESAVEPIDVSSGEDAVSVETDATDLEDLTAMGTASEADDADDSDGITTAYDEAVATDDPSSGITDADAGTELSADSPSAVDTDVPASADTDATPSTSSDDAETNSAASAVPESDTDSSDDGSSGPDPADVEAAAEQLEQNDISWTEDDTAADDDADSDTPVDTAGSEQSESATETQADTDTSTRTSTDTDTGATGTSAVTAPAAGTADDSDSSESDATATTDDADAADTEDSQLEERFEEEEQWRETRSIPSIDPDNSVATESASARTRARRSQRASSRTAQSSSQTTADTGTSEQEPQPPSKRSNSASPSNADTTRQDQRSSRAETGPDTSNTSVASRASQSPSRSERNSRLERLTDRIERLEEQREALESKNKELVSERDRLRKQNQELVETVDRLEARIDELEASNDVSVSSSSTTDLAPDRALAGTNLFVRYVSKSQPTLEMAHDGEADRDEVATNLRLEQHTEFEADAVAVDGTPYEEYLDSTMAYQFVDWLTEMALYEIRDTGHAGGLADLYDAIPRIDRAELNATISLEDDETDDVPDEVTFDVVAFDKMGNPLVLATLNDSREPVTEETLVELEEAASAVKANYPDLAASMAVTSSYFEPGALEVTEQATSSGLLSRGSKLSYVNLSRKQGYHLCLVESRSEGFHMNVPEL